MKKYMEGLAKAFVISLVFLPLGLLLNLFIRSKAKDRVTVIEEDGE